MQTLWRVLAINMAMLMVGCGADVQPPAPTATAATETATAMPATSATWVILSGTETTTATFEPTQTSPTATATTRPTLAPAVATAAPSGSAATDSDAGIDLEALISDVLGTEYHLQKSYVRAGLDGGKVLVIETRFDSTSMRIVPFHARLFVQLLQGELDLTGIWFSADGNDPYSISVDAEDIEQYAAGALSDFELMLRMQVTYTEHECDC